MALAEKLTKVYKLPVKTTKPYWCNDGRRRIDIYTPEGSKTCLLARVKLEIKLKRRLADDEEVDHRDNDKTNDKYSNLQVLSKRDNVLKSLGNRLDSQHEFMRSEEGRVELSELVKGELNPMACFSDFNVEQYRIAFSKGDETVKSLVFKTGNSSRAVRNMLTGISYSHVPGPLAKLNRGRPPKE
jgi:hypothetical protein